MRGWRCQDKPCDRGASIGGTAKVNGTCADMDCTATVVVHNRRYTYGSLDVPKVTVKCNDQVHCHAFDKFNAFASRLVSFLGDSKETCHLFRRWTRMPNLGGTRPTFMIVNVRVTATQAMLNSGRSGNEHGTKLVVLLCHLTSQPTANPSQNIKPAKPAMTQPKPGGGCISFHCFSVSKIMRGLSSSIATLPS